jgi:succinate dehydrogenase flavin-adding protein (antitoxin of CptAB toxin-antitoxin module)
MIIFLGLESYQERINGLTDVELEQWVQSYMLEMPKELRDTFEILNKQEDKNLLRQRLAAYLYGTQII